MVMVHVLGLCADTERISVFAGARSYGRPLLLIAIGWAGDSWKLRCTLSAFSLPLISQHKQLHSLL